MRMVIGPRPLLSRRTTAKRDQITLAHGRDVGLSDWLHATGHR